LNRAPPIIWQKRRLIASPRPVPPYLLAVAEDALENSWNNFPIYSGVTPMPASATTSVIQSRPFSCRRTAHVRGGTALSMYSRTTS
jgi:hypothetical protein